MNRNAGDPGFTELLLAMGLRSFSMHPTQLVQVKQRIIRTDTRRWGASLSEILESENPEARYLTELHSIATSQFGAARAAMPSKG